jgi:hypothetical protein
MKEETKFRVQSLKFKVEAVILCVVEGCLKELKIQSKGV